jgi:hypothetical protein
MLDYLKLLKLLKRGSGTLSANSLLFCFTLRKIKDLKSIIIIIEGVSDDKTTSY